MFCHNCGADAGTAKFCPNCGTRIVVQDAAAERGTGTLTLRKYRSEKMQDLAADIYLDGEFNTVITGPGRVYLQTMTAARLAGQILPYLPIQK